MTPTLGTTFNPSSGKWFDVETPRGEGADSKAIVRELLETESEYVFSGATAPISDNPITISSRTKVVYIDASTIHISIAYPEQQQFGSPVTFPRLFFAATASGYSLLPGGNVFGGGERGKRRVGSIFSLTIADGMAYDSQLRGEFLFWESSSVSNGTFLNENTHRSHFK